ncbi:MAG: hypothetical protein ACOCG5_00375 [Candidatus Alkaliphilus sp. MAG34]|nr:hypothetical protein [Clostridiales bacterium]
MKTTVVMEVAGVGGQMILFTPGKQGYLPLLERANTMQYNVVIGVQNGFPVLGNIQGGGFNGYI